MKEKEGSVISYHDGTDQLLSDSHLGKYLGKRKNDAIWDGVSHLMLIRPEVKPPIKKDFYHYVRSEDTLPYLEPLVEKLGNEIDALEEKNLVTGPSAKEMIKMGTMRNEEEDDF